jgi:hypothetical protein
MPTLATLCAFLACGPAYGATWEAERPGRLGDIAVSGYVQPIATADAEMKGGRIDAHVMLAGTEMRASWLAWGMTHPRVVALDDLALEGVALSMRVPDSPPLYVAQE